MLNDAVEKLKYCYSCYFYLFVYYYYSYYKIKFLQFTVLPSCKDASRPSDSYYTLDLVFHYCRPRKRFLTPYTLHLTATANNVHVILVGGFFCAGFAISAFGKSEYVSDELILRIF